MDEFLSLFRVVLKTFEVGQSPQTFLVLVGLAFARLLSFLVVAPFFGGSAVPARVKVATAAALVILVYPALAAGLPPAADSLPFGPVGFVALLTKEVVVGFTLGFISSLVFEAVQVSGRLVDQQRGASMSETLAPQLQTRVSELGQIKLQLAIVLFLFVGAHRFFMRALLTSFVVVPPTEFVRLSGGWTPLTAFVVELTAQVLTAGVQLAIAPIIALLLTDIFFGIVNRIAPQINVFFLSMPVKALVGIFVVLVTLQLLRDRFLYLFAKAAEDFEFIIRAFAAS